MSKRFAILALCLAVQGVGRLGNGAVLCVGDAGHQEIEVANAHCCANRPEAETTPLRWLAEDPCGPCVDLPFGSPSLSTDASREQRDQVFSPLVPAVACACPRNLRVARVSDATPGERLKSARATSPLRV